MWSRPGARPCGAIAAVALVLMGTIVLAGCGGAAAFDEDTGDNADSDATLSQVVLEIPTVF